MSDVLVTMPKSDQTVRHLLSWTKDYISRIRNKNIKVHCLEAEKANRKNVESYLKKIEPDYCHFNGHGSNQAIFGNDLQPIIEEGVNEEVLSNRIVYSLSCNSAASLGKKAVKKGAISFIGYIGNFIFTTDSHKHKNPLHDKVAGQFMKPAMLISESIIKGNTVEQAVNKSKASFRKQIRKLLASEVSDEDAANIRFLFWDMTYLVAHGDSQAKLSHR